MRRKGVSAIRPPPRVTWPSLECRSKLRHFSQMCSDICSMSVLGSARGQLAFPLIRGSCSETPAANTRPVALLTDCPNGHLCSVGEVSLGIWGRVWGAPKCVPRVWGAWKRRIMKVPTF